MLNLLGDCLWHTALTSPGFFLAIFLIFVFSWAWCSFHLTAGLGWYGWGCATYQITGVYTCLFQHLRELCKLTLMLCLFGTLFLCGFKAFCINLIEFFFSFFKLFKWQFAQGSTKTTDIQ